MTTMVWSSREIVEHAGYHTISATRGRQPFFADPLNAEKVVDAIRFASESERAFVLAYCVMTDHMHLLLVPRGSQTISSVMLDIKRYSAKAINERLGRRGPIWQQSFYDRMIRGDAHLSSTIAYIEGNAVAARLVKEPEEYRFSSASPEGFNDNERFWSE
jgi:REP element-mobilizing transposase RayT